MRREEATVVYDLVRSLQLNTGATCLNIGSSTKRFREIAQPHISERLIEPMKRDGIKVVHCDLKNDDGVDLVGDVLNIDFQSSLQQQQPDLILCLNVLEHVKERKMLISALTRIAPIGCIVVVSVPSSYPYHADPIDTMYRPSPSELLSEFGAWSALKGLEVTSTTYLNDLRSSAKGWYILTIHIAEVLMPFRRPQQWWGKLHRLLWLFRQYKVSIAVLKKV